MSSAANDTTPQTELVKTAKALGKLTCTTIGLVDVYSPGHIRKCTMHAILFGQALGEAAAKSEATNE